MTHRFSSLRLAFSFVRNRPVQAVILVLLGLVLASSVVGLAIIRDSAERALDDSLRADLGYRTYVLQTGDAQALQVMKGLSSAAPVEDTNGDVLLNGLAEPVIIRRTTDATLHLGVLTSGHRPRMPGDVVLSQATAAALNIGVGATIGVRIDGPEVRVHVTGLSVDPANPSSSTLVELVGGNDAIAPNRWLSDTDFYAEPGLKPALDRRTATYQSIGPLLQTAAESRPQFLSAMHFMPAGTGILFAIVIVAVLGALSRSWRVYVDALVASGMTRSAAWHRMLWIAFSLILLGEISGCALVATATFEFRVPLSGWFGQHWVSVAVALPEALLVCGFTLASAVIATWIPRYGPMVVTWSSRREAHPRRWGAPAAYTAAVAAIIVWTLAILLNKHGARASAAGVRSAVAATIAVTVLTAVLPFVLSSLCSFGLPAASRRVLAHVLGYWRPVLAVAAIVVLASAAWSAQATRDANRGEAASSPLEPPGSFVISALPDSAIGSLTDMYRQHGGSTVVFYQIPDETTSELRVTSTSVIKCMSQQHILDPNQVPQSCEPLHAGSSLARIMIGAPGSPARADPGLIQNGRVGLLLFRPDNVTASRLADTAAQPDPMLGGNIAGLVVPPESPVARQFGLTAGGTSEVLLLDFNRLTPHDRLSMRASAIRIAAGAETADGTDPTAYDRLRSIANTVSILGATLAAIILLLGGMAMVTAHKLVRRALVDLAAASRPRWIFITRLAVLPCLLIACTVALTVPTATFGRTMNANSFGTLWLLPAAVALIATTAVVIAFIRSPGTDGNL